MSSVLPKMYVQFSAAYITVVLTYAVWTALPLPQNWSFTGHRRTGLRVAADHPIHADTASANIGFPRLCCQENVSLVTFAVAGQTVIARYGRLKKFIWKIECKHLVAGSVSSDLLNWANYMDIRYKISPALGTVQLVSSKQARLQGGK